MSFTLLECRRKVAREVLRKLSITNGFKYTQLLTDIKRIFHYYFRFTFLNICNTTLHIPHREPYATTNIILLFTKYYTFNMKTRQNKVTGYDTFM